MPVDPKKFSIPQSPGVYIYKNPKGKIIYVGKAINLKRRVYQYFQRDDALGPKTSTLVSQIADIEVRPLESELQALIVESSLIKKYRPKYNSLLKDDRSYTYICITKDKYPLIISTHYSQIPPRADVFGPFPDSRAVKSLLKSLRRAFPYYSKPHHPVKRCLYCHLRLCPGPSPNVKTYRSNITRIKQILQGNYKGLQRQLKKKIQQNSQEENYEKALIFRNQLQAVEYVTAGWHNLAPYLKSAELPEDQTSSALDELTILLKAFYPRISPIKKIEAFDISNLGSKYFVGSMVVFDNNQIDNSQYRKFKIYTKATADDQFMIKETVWRRLKHPEWSYPDIILVDGGKPQVTAAHQALALQSTKNIPIIGLAKRNETIVVKTIDGWQEARLPAFSSSLRLLQRLRDEAHRFANRYRKELMKKHIIIT